jgi:hypothetical protein
MILVFVQELFSSSHGADEVCLFQKRKRLSSSNFGLQECNLLHTIHWFALCLHTRNKEKD